VMTGVCNAVQQGAAMVAAALSGAPLCPV